MKNEHSKSLIKKYALVIALSALVGFIFGWKGDDAVLIPIFIAVFLVPIFAVMCLLFAIVKKRKDKLRWALPVLIGAIVASSVSLIASNLREDYDTNRKEKARLKQVAQHPALIDEYIAKHRTTTAKEFSRYKLVISRTNNQFTGYKYSYTYLFEYPNNVTDTVFFVFEHADSNVEVSANFEKNPFTPFEEKLIAKLDIKLAFKQFEPEHYNLKLDELANLEETLFTRYISSFNKMSDVDLYLRTKEVDCKLKPMAVPISGFDFYYWDITNIPTLESIKKLDSFIENMYINHLSYQQYIPAYRRSAITLTADRTPSEFYCFYVPRVKGEDIIKAFMNGASFSEYNDYSLESAIIRDHIKKNLEDTRQDLDDKKNLHNTIKEYLNVKIKASLQKEYLDALMLPYKQDFESRKLKY